MADIHDFDPPTIMPEETAETRKGYDWTQARGPDPQPHRGVHWEGYWAEDCPACQEMRSES